MPEIDSNGIKLFYSDSEDSFKTKQPVVLIHGLGGCLEFWKYQRGFIEKRGYRCISVDIRSHGRSGKTTIPCTIELLAEDITGLIRKLNLDPCIIAGHSLGGMMTYQLAISHPELVKKIVILNCFTHINHFDLKAAITLLYRNSIIYTMGLQKWGAILSKKMLPSPEHENMRKEFRTLFRFNNNKKAYFSILKAVVKMNLKTQLHKIRCPVLVIHSDHDYAPFEEMEDDVSRISKTNNKVMVKKIFNSRHFPMWEHPEEINKAIEEFLDKY